MGALVREVLVLTAEDDPDDQVLIRDAFREIGLAGSLTFVSDGEELLEYLYGSGQYANREEFPLPGLILLDLNMPRKDGREALQQIKSDPALRQIPVIVLSTSRAEEDILKTYDLGVNSFIVKPATFDRLVEIALQLRSYWLDTVEIPDSGRRS